MWRQHRDVAFSPQGLFKSMQYGAKAKDLQEVLNSCIMCGACDVMCPENIAITSMITNARELGDTAEPDEQQVSELTPFIISCDPFVQAQLSRDDLYIIDAAVFHQYHATRVAHYTALRERTGCQINLDLNRMAIATGAGSLSESLGLFDVQAQLEWLIQGRSFKRVIVENIKDTEKLSQIMGEPVVHIAELMERHITRDETDHA